jgi:hypothetical protein
VTKCSHERQIVLQQYGIVDKPSLVELYEAEKDWGFDQRESNGAYVSASVALIFCVNCGRIRGKVTSAIQRS